MKSKLIPLFLLASSILSFAEIYSGDLNHQTDSLCSTIESNGKSIRHELQQLNQKFDTLFSNLRPTYKYNITTNISSISYKTNRLNFVIPKTNYIYYTNSVEIIEPKIKIVIIYSTTTNKVELLWGE